MKYTLSTAITLANFKEALHTLMAALPGLPGENVELDFTQVPQIDSSALSYVLHGIRDASKRGYSLKLTNLPSSFTELANLYGLTPLLEPYLCSPSYPSD